MLTLKQAIDLRLASVRREYGVKLDPMLRTGYAQQVEAEWLAEFMETAARDPRSISAAAWRALKRISEHSYSLAFRYADATGHTFYRIPAIAAAKGES